MSVKVQLTGLDELVRAMWEAPAAIRAEGLAIVREATEGAASEIRRNYPEQSHTATGTGNLVRSVQTTYPSSTVLAGIVRVAAPHAFIYEEGTAPRRTAKGYNRGVMPSHRVVPVVAPKYRARMFERLAELVERTGLFTVTR